jgi:N-acetyl-S-(2-succino)cysteine monooxygenase
MARRPAISVWPVVVQGAHIAERGKFDLFFVSDSAVMNYGDHPSFMTRFEPTTLIAALSTVTRHVGLGATMSTSFSERRKPAAFTKLI